MLQKECGQAAAIGRSKGGQGVFAEVGTAFFQKGRRLYHSHSERKG
jgi:hypothetical protein